MAKVQPLYLERLLAESEPVNLVYGLNFNLAEGEDPLILSTGDYKVNREEWQWALFGPYAWDIMVIDPSLNSTGICLASENNDAFLTGTILPGFKKPGNKTVDSYLEGQKRHRFNFKSFEHILELVQPKIFLIEGLGYQTKGQAAELAGVYKGFMDRLYDYCLRHPDAKVAEVPATRLKKMATGNGKATKPMMAAAAKELYGVDFLLKDWVPKRKGETHPKMDDEVDAFLFAKILIAYLDGLFDKKLIKLTRSF